MRKLLFIAILFISCEKEKCYTCQTIVEYTNVPNSRVETSQRKCGTVDEVNDFQDEANFSMYDDQGNEIGYSWRNCK